LVGEVSFRFGALELLASSETTRLKVKSTRDLTC
jgi:hypothetical protein